MSQVIFTEDEEKFKQQLKEQIKDLFLPDEKIAIKLHMGEPGNKFHLKPEFVKIIVDVLKELGCKPFLFDSPVVYNSPRNTEEGYYKVAEQHGFTDICPVIISDEHITIKGKKMNYQICKTLANADGILVLSHVKGHLCTGFGGAIKNLGMGAQTKHTKGSIHAGGEPKYVGGCTRCDICASVCPTSNIRYDDVRPHFDKNWCCGCSNCAIFCPEKAIEPKLDTFDFLLSEAAWAAKQHFKKDYYVNVIKSISKNCDCDSNAGPIVLDDVGITMGKDIVAVEKASLDLINKKASKDLFKEIHHKSPERHIKFAEELEMGKMEYELVRL